VTGVAEGHRGQDFGAPAGTPIIYAAAGIVVRAGPAGGFGQWIVIDHQIGGQLVSTVYGHIWADGVGVSEGEPVRTGQPIGRVDSNGPSTGPHLHFEVWEGGRSRGGRAKAAPSIPCGRVGRSGNWAVLCRGCCLDGWGPVLLILVKVDRLRCSSLSPMVVPARATTTQKRPVRAGLTTSGPDLSGRTGPGRSTSSATSPLGEERRSRRR